MLSETSHLTSLQVQLLKRHDAAGEILEEVQDELDKVCLKLSLCVRLLKQRVQGLTSHHHPPALEILSCCSEAT